MANNHCTSCGTVLSAASRFCANCGAPVTAAIREASGAEQAARKQLSRKPRGRDAVIMVAAVATVTVAYFALRTPAQPPQPPQAAQPAGHADIPGSPMGGSMAGLEGLPADYAGLVMNGNQFMDQGNYAVAAECYRRALALDPAHPDVRTDFGACLHGMGLPDRALAEFRTVIKDYPEHAIANFNAGIIFLDLGQTDSAKVYWQKYLTIDPNGPAAGKAKELLQTIDG